MCRKEATSKRNPPGLARRWSTSRGTLGLFCSWLCLAGQLNHDRMEPAYVSILLTSIGRQFANARLYYPVYFTVKDA